MNRDASRTPSGKPRARHYGIEFEGETGPLNAITDVPGVAVGYVTLISGDGPLVVGQGTGPHRRHRHPAAAEGRARDAGLRRHVQRQRQWRDDRHASGSRRSARSTSRSPSPTRIPAASRATARCAGCNDALPGAIDKDWGLPVAAETYDGFLNDINGHHVTVEHVAQALDGATAARSSRAASAAAPA